MTYTEHAKQRRRERSIPKDLIEYVMKRGERRISLLGHRVYFMTLKKVPKELLGVKTPPEAYGIKIVCGQNGDVITTTWKEREP